jgi:acetamidase/formamidase
MLSLALSILFSQSAAGQTPAIIPTTYYRTFSHSHPVLKRIRPGEAVATKTLDSGGVDENDVKQSEPFNPLNGPFYVEGAEPGDAVAVKITKLTMNRNWGWSAYRLGLFSLTPEHVEHVYSSNYKLDLIRKGRSNLVPWDIDLKKKTVRLREPSSKVIGMEFPAKPMLGCIGVAPAGDFAPTSGPSGSYGGNLDYNRIGEGATVVLPVYHAGGLLFVGDGHALQADGEPTGTGIETSLDVEFVVEVRKKAGLTGPRVETNEDIISIGSQPEFASALDNGLKMATSDMADWLVKDYGLEPWAAHLLIGYQGKYDIVTVAGSMALRIPKRLLPPKTESTAPAKVQAEPARPKSPPAISDKVASLRKIDGFVPLYWDEAAGRLFMEVSRFDEELLYQVGLATGVGSNPVGLDRGQLGETHVVAFHRVGPKLLLIEPNYRYRALSDRAAERRAVEESFAQSVLAGFTIEAEEAGRVLVDASTFFLRDAHGVSQRLRKSEQGRYQLDGSRSALRLERTKGFPKNTEVEALLTFTTDDEPGKLVAETSPAARSITVHQHHSLVQLPPLEGGYKPRRLDPRVGVFGIEFYDYAKPVGVPIETRWIARHGLAKKDPKAAVSEPVSPIVYYVDPGAPEPIRTALVEGASWWNTAFEAAGFQNAFRVEILPEDADPMDLRYNVIMWVHRSTRGWSYGTTVTDPRTGEILKGAVTLDSLRARQDALIGNGLVSGRSGVDGCDMAMPPGPEYLAALDSRSDPEAMVLARIRQLSAHEVGHTLGFAHNFAASTYGRASVMDYPAPLVKILDDKLDLSDAYATGIGLYDIHAVKYAYSQFAPGVSETAELERIVQAGVAAGMLFVSDADARPDGGAHPLANLWDNGDDPVAGLRHEMNVRRIGLSNFGLRNVAEGEPLASLESKLLPLYLHHRYQLRAAAKSVGGAYYTNAVRAGSGSNPTRVLEIVPAERQREALAAVLSAIDPKELTIPSRILDLIPPTAFGYDGGTSELFGKKTSPIFDPIAAATIAADLAITALLNPERASRLEAFHSRNSDNPDFAEVLSSLLTQTWGAPSPDDTQESAILRAIQNVTLTRLIELCADENATPQVRAISAQALQELAERQLPRKPPAELVHRLAARREILRFLSRPDATFRRSPTQPAPPGDPIGQQAR